MDGARTRDVLHGPNTQVDYDRPWLSHQHQPVRIFEVHHTYRKSASRSTGSRHKLPGVFNKQSFRHSADTDRPRLCAAIKEFMNWTIVLHKPKFVARERRCGHLLTPLETSPSPHSHREHIKLLQRNSQRVTSARSEATEADSVVNESTRSLELHDYLLTQPILVVIELFSHVYT